MAEISLCMIVRDEEDVLRRCLESAVPLVDEIIIADTGSKDKTCEIAREFTDQVYHFDWCDDFAAARNFAFSKASKPFCMWLDADDVILPEDQQKFLARKGLDGEKVPPVCRIVRGEDGVHRVVMQRRPVAGEAALAGGEDHVRLPFFQQLKRLELMVDRPQVHVDMRADAAEAV